MNRYIGAVLGLFGLFIHAHGVQEVFEADDSYTFSIEKALHKVLGLYSWDSSAEVQQLRSRSLQSDPIFSLPDDFAPCLDNMDRADFDRNGLLDTLEYAVLVELQSEGRVDEPFIQLPLEFIAVFNSYICRTCPQITGDPDCCIKGRFINITTPGTEEYVDTVTYFCNIIDYILRLLFPPTEVPSLSPSSSSAPTTLMSDAPTESSSPSTEPTSSPSSAPSLLPSRFPSSTPSQIPTPAPTMTPLLCTSISYRVDNQAGLTASDILNGVNNTVKNGLEIAARTVTIDILNGTEVESSPGDSRSRLSIHPATLEEIARVEGRRLVEWQQIYDTYEEETVDRHRSLSRHRRLVFYSDSFPNLVLQVFDLPDSDCPDGSNCAIVLHRICVVLEEGDDEGEVRELLTEGLGDALESGAFEDAFPDEDIPIGPIG